MKSVSYVILLLLVLSVASSLRARTMTVLYYPDSSDPLVFAFSPNATNSAPVSNPTLTIKPGSSVVIPLADGVRAWYYTPAVGWTFLTASDDIAHGGATWDVVCVFAGSGGAMSYEVPIVASTATSEDYSLSVDSFWIGFAGMLPLVIVAWIIRGARAGMEIGAVD
jgi:hypothetical protein